MAEAMEAVVEEDMVVEAVVVVRTLHTPLDWLPNRLQATACPT